MADFVLRSTAPSEIFWRKKKMGEWQEYSQIAYGKLYSADFGLVSSPHVEYCQQAWRSYHGKNMLAKYRGEQLNLFQDW